MKKVIKARSRRKIWVKKFTSNVTVIFSKYVSFTGFEEFLTAVYSDYIKNTKQLKITTPPKTSNNKYINDATYTLYVKQRYIY